MKNPVFGEFVFDTGWKAKTDIGLFGANHMIVVKAASYFEKDKITPEQERAFENYNKNKADILKKAEDLLIGHMGAEASRRLVPKTLLFRRDGSYALLLDDQEDEDKDVAVCLAPTAEVMPQEEYL